MIVLNIFQTNTNLSQVCVMWMCVCMYVCVHLCTYRIMYVATFIFCQGLKVIICSIATYLVLYMFCIVCIDVLYMCVCSGREE